MATSRATYRYEQIAETLREQIAEGAFSVDGKLPSEQDLAQHFNVNRLTLRKAVDLLEGEGLVTRHRGRGTFLGQPMDAADARAYVYVGNVSEHVWSDVYAALGAALQDDGHRIAAYQPADGEVDNGFGTWVQRLSDEPAVICQENAWSRIEPVVQALQLRAVVVHFPVKEETVSVPMIASDSRRGAMLATRELIRRGHRDIAFIGFGSDAGPTGRFWLPFASNLALAGYLQAMREEDLPVTDRLMGSYGEGPELRAHMRAFIEHLGRWPTAFVCQQDFKVRDLLTVAQEDGLSVPADLSIISMGNTPWSQALVPSLTSVDVRPAAMADLALHVLHTPAECTAPVYRLEPRLVHRESVANPRHNEELP